MPACIGGCEMNRFLTIQKYYVGVVQLLLASGLMPALGQAGASGEELLPSARFSCGAAHGCTGKCLTFRLPVLA